MEQIYTGIDVAKDSFMVATRQEGKVNTSLHHNDKKGIGGFLKNLSSDTWCIMEATGVYSLQLAFALYEKGIKVSVVNPLQINCFAQTTYQICQSMSRVDDPYDNAFAESFWSRFKVEMLGSGAFLDVVDARTEISDYIEVYHNRVRRHSALGYKCPLF